MTEFANLTLLDSSYIFDFESFIINDLKISLDKPLFESTQTCKFYLRGNCQKGADCPNKHSVEKTIVCKHWLRGLCKKGEMCEFLHEYNLKKMPECWFFTKNGECSNPECLYRHIDPNSKIHDCAWYLRGFCRHGSGCKHKHTRRLACQNYLTGFCPKGPDCDKGHPKFELPTSSSVWNNKSEPVLVDHMKYQNSNPPTQSHGAGPSKAHLGNNFRPLEEVQCFKCGERGHFANHCPTRAVHRPRQQYQQY
ncbi:MAG: hypothetical protein SGCHY_004191 [Lobulomycetales sp.]